MKKIIFTIYFICLFNVISSCSGYKPIFSTTNLQFKINNHYIKGATILGNLLYSKLKNLSKFDKNNEGAKGIDIVLNVSKTKKSTSKDRAGKILEYRISLNTDVEVTDFLSGEKILNKNFNSSLNYKVQDQYSDTLAREKKVIEDLINETYSNLLITLSENINQI